MLIYIYIYILLNWFYSTMSEAFLLNFLFFFGIKMHDQRSPAQTGCERSVSLSVINSIGVVFCFIIFLIYFSE